MKWADARAIARTGLWVSRAAWPSDRRLAYRFPGVAVVVSGAGEEHVATAADFGPADFVAADWRRWTPALAASSSAAGQTTVGVSGIIIGCVTPVDDDLAIRCNGRWVMDTQLNSGWYDGATRTYPSAWPPAGGRAPRHVTLLPEHFLAAGIVLAAGLLVEVFVFDGWGNTAATGTWVATIHYADGTTKTASGGSVWSGTSAVTHTTGGIWAWPGGSAWVTGPHFASYIPNGSFRLP